MFNLTATELQLTVSQLHERIMRAGATLQEQCHRAARDAGWWTDKDGGPVLVLPTE